MTRTPELLVADLRDEFDWERERLVALRLRPAAALFRDQLGAFIAWVESTADEPPRPAAE